MKKLCCVASALISLAVSAGAETNEVERSVLSRLHGSAYADVETAYWARGAIVNRDPYSAQFAQLSADLDPFGRLGGYAWSVTAFSRGGQSACRQTWYNEVDYGVFYGCALEITEGWKLDTVVAKKWVTLPGYHPHAETISEWNLSQSLENPFVTPYYLLRSAVDGGGKWNYWDVGLVRSWEFLDDFTFTAQIFAELGDSRHLRAQYGANPNSADGSYSSGIMTLNLLLRLDYAITEWFGVFAFVHQFDVVCDDARDALDRSPAPEAIRDLTIGGVGLKFNF